MKKLVSLLLILTLALTLGGVASAEKKWEGHTIVFASWGDGAEKAATEKVIAAFEEATGCKVNYINISSDYDTKVTAMVAAGETIDCAQLESGSIAYPMAAEGLLEPLDSYIEDSGINMDDYVAASCYYDDNGNLIAWSGCIELMCLFYSRDVFDEAGLPYPPSDPDEAWTWDEFVDVATKLTKHSNGEIQRTIQNCITILQNDHVLADAIRLNLLSERIDIVKPVGWPRSGKTLNDTDMKYILRRMEKYGISSEKKIESAIRIVANENRYHPIRDYLNGL